MSWISNLLNRFRRSTPPLAPPSEHAPDLLAVVNVARQGYGRTSLAASARLDQAAQLQADACARLGRLDHQAAGPLAQRLSGSVYGSAGECLAYAPGMSPAQVVSLWLGDPPHRRVVLGDYRAAGVGHTGGYWCLDATSENPT